MFAIYNSKVLKPIFQQSYSFIVVVIFRHSIEVREPSGACKRTASKDAIASAHISGTEVHRGKTNARKVVVVDLILRLEIIKHIVRQRVEIQLIVVLIHGKSLIII